jgi:hypothetical protein
MHIWDIQYCGLSIGQLWNSSGPGTIFLKVLRYRCKLNISVIFPSASRFPSNSLLLTFYHQMFVYIYNVQNPCMAFSVSLVFSLQRADISTSNPPKLKARLLSPTQAHLFYVHTSSLQYGCQLLCQCQRCWLPVSTCTHAHMPPITDE